MIEHRTKTPKKFKKIKAAPGEIDLDKREERREKREEIDLFNQPEQIDEAEKQRGRTADQDEDGG